MCTDNKGKEYNKDVGFNISLQKVFNSKKKVVFFPFEAKLYILPNFQNNNKTNICFPLEFYVKS